MDSWCVCFFADLIPELYGQSVRIVDGRVVWLKGDVDVLALEWANTALSWYHTEHTHPIVVLGSCKAHKKHKSQIDRKEGTP